jgi:hypothetical protein
MISLVVVAVDHDKHRANLATAGRAGSLIAAQFRYVLCRGLTAYGGGSRLATVEIQPTLLQAPRPSGMRGKSTCVRSSTLVSQIVMQRSNVQGRAPLPAAARDGDGRAQRGPAAKDPGGSRQMEQLMKIVEKAGARMVLLSDTVQHAPLVRDAGAHEWCKARLPGRSARPQCARLLQCLRQMDQQQERP